MKTNKIFVAVSILCASSLSMANCIGSGNLKTCYDDAGNSYIVNRLGNTTYVDGMNSRGETWSSTSTTYGNTTYQDGTSKDGGHWNQTILDSGTYQTYDGTDSDGNTYITTCTEYGCY